MSSSKEPLIYAQPQIEIIRNALKKGFQRGRDIYGAEFTMMSLAAQIENRFDVRTDEELQRFPEEYHGIEEVFLTRSPESGGRTDSFGRFLRKQSKRMNNIRIIACELYLTDPDCEFASLTRQDIYQEKPELSAPVYLANFLNPHGVKNNPLTTDLMHSFYGASSPDIESQLSLMPSSEACVLSAELENEHYRFSPNDAEKEPWKVEKYIGWAVTTEEENIIVALKNYIKHTVVLYNTIAIETNFYQGQKVNSFILFPFLNPMQIVNSDENEMEDLLSEHKISVPTNSLIFTNKEATS